MLLPNKERAILPINTIIRIDCLVITCYHMISDFIIAGVIRIIDKWQNYIHDAISYIVVWRRVSCWRFPIKCFHEESPLDIEENIKGLLDISILQRFCRNSVDVCERYVWFLIIFQFYSLWRRIVYFIYSIFFLLGKCPYLNFL